MNLIFKKKFQEIKKMEEIKKEKSSDTTAQNLTRHEKSIEERRKRQADSLRANLKKRKAQRQQRSNPNLQGC